MLRLKACVCTHESKCTRRARFRWLILNVSACQTTRFSVCSILHATPSVKERCIALGHRNKMGDFNDLADEMHNPYATNAGGSKKKKRKKRRCQAMVCMAAFFSRAPRMLPPSHPAFHALLSALVTSANS